LTLNLICLNVSGSSFWPVVFSFGISWHYVILNHCLFTLKCSEARAKITKEPQSKTKSSLLHYLPCLNQLLCFELIIRTLPQIIRRNQALIRLEVAQILLVGKPIATGDDDDVMMFCLYSAVFPCYSSMLAALKENK
jgi:hypothetical protein